MRESAELLLTSPGAPPAACVSLLGVVRDRGPVLGTSIDYMLNTLSIYKLRMVNVELTREVDKPIASAPLLLPALPNSEWLGLACAAELERPHRHVIGSKLFHVSAPQADHLTVARPVPKPPAPHSREKQNKDPKPDS